MVAAARRGWIGVDIGSRAIKLAQVEQVADRLRLLDAVVVPRMKAPGGSLTDDRAAGCREELRAALTAGSGFLGRIAACAMSMYWCHARPTRITADTAAAQRAAIGGELRALHCTEECEFDFWETGTVPDASEPRIQEAIALAIPRRSVVQVAGDLVGCGLDCRALDALPLTLTRAVRMIAGSDDHCPLAAVDWGFTEATFCAISGRVPTFVRRLRGCGFGSVLQQVSRELGLHMDEVETLLTDGHSASAVGGHSVRSELHAAIAEIASQPLRIIVEELQRTLTFLETQSPVASPERVWLFGAGALWNNAAEFLASKITQPVDIWRFQNAGIERAAGKAFPEEILAPAITLSALAWSTP